MSRWISYYLEFSEYFALLKTLLPRDQMEMFITPYRKHLFWGGTEFNYLHFDLYCAWMCLMSHLLCAYWHLPLMWMQAVLYTSPFQYGKSKLNMPSTSSAAKVNMRKNILSAIWAAWIVAKETSCGKQKKIRADTKKEKIVFRNLKPQNGTLKRDLLYITFNPDL